MCSEARLKKLPAKRSLISIDGRNVAPHPMGEASVVSVPICGREWGPKHDPSNAPNVTKLEDRGRLAETILVDPANCA